MNTLGQYIRELRTARGLTLDKVAGELGVSKAYVSLIEKDKSGISLENIGKLANLLGADARHLIDLQDVKRETKTEPWLRYLIAKYQPSEYVLGVCKKYVIASGLSDIANDESAPGFESRWDAFFNLVKGVLDNPSIRFFGDASVQTALRLAGIKSCESWPDLYEKIFLILEDKFGDLRRQVYATSKEWRNDVARLLGIETVSLNNFVTSKQMVKMLSMGGSENVIAGMTMVAASPMIYGSIYNLNYTEPSDWRYCFVEDRTGEKDALGSEPFWHEAARVFIDPDLTMGQGCGYNPDGVEITPINFLLTRIAGWMALYFARKTQMIKSLQGAKLISPAEIMKFRNLVCPDLPIRFTTIASLDMIEEPLIYLDCYKRLKVQQLQEKNIHISDLAAMAADPDSKLRVGFSFRNLKATSEAIDIRRNIVVGPNSAIAKAYAKHSEEAALEDLTSWDMRYNLKGTVECVALYAEAGHDNVRAIMRVLPSR